MLMCTAMQRPVFEGDGRSVRLSANACQLHRPNTIPIFCAVGYRIGRLRTFLYLVELVLSYDLVEFLVVQQLIECVCYNFVLVVVLDVVQARVAVCVFLVAV